MKKISKAKFFEEIDKSLIKNTNIFLCDNIYCDQCFLEKECYKKFPLSDDLRIQNTKIFLENKLIQYKAKILSKKI